MNRLTAAKAKYSGVATPMTKIEQKVTMRLWTVNCTLKARLLSRSSWSFVVLEMILPVGVTSNHDNGVCNSTSISFLWIACDEFVINFAKITPLR